MESGEEIKCNLVLPLQGPICLDDVKQFHCFANMNQLTVVNAQDPKIRHFWNKERKNFSGEERNPMQLKISKVIRKVGNRKACHIE
jgi:hypothetical protein